MVKQGKFASSTRSMRSKTQRYKAVSGQGKINPEDAAEYVMVRYHLTRGKKQSALIEQTILRLLDVLVPELQANRGDVGSTITGHLKKASVSVPWQYYKVIVDEWPSLIMWLKKEVTGLPLEEKLLLQNIPMNLNSEAAVQLAINWWLFQSAENPQRLASVTEDKINSLADTFIMADSIEWTIMKTVYSTVQFVPNDSFDEETTNWLKTLSEMA